MEKLFEAYRLGKITLRNRVAMAPMTRSRADIQKIQTPLAATYYRQRASAGLIVSEATSISPIAGGYVKIPGIYTREQVDAWKPVTEAVHKEEGVIFCQLWHTGRVSHSLNLNGLHPVAPSAIKAHGEIHTLQGMKPYETPKAMTAEEIKQTVMDYKQAALNVIEAGFDGVELHAANGYLPHQFLSDSSNQRTDEYGGSAENRTRFVLETLQAMADAIGSERVGIRLSPSRVFGEPEKDPKEWFVYLLEQLNELDLAYLHTTEPMRFAPDPLPDSYLKEVAPFARKIYKGTLIANGGLKHESAEALLQNNIADVVAFGTLFIANPDLPKRFKENAPMNNPDRQTFYGGGEKGYIDYPMLEEKKV